MPKGRRLQQESEVTRFDLALGRHKGDYPVCSAPNMWCVSVWKKIVFVLPTNLLCLAISNTFSEYWNLISNRNLRREISSSNLIFIVIWKVWPNQPLCRRSGSTAWKSSGQCLILLVDSSDNGARWQISLSCNLWLVNFKRYFRQSRNVYNVTPLMKSVSRMRAIC